MRAAIVVLVGLFARSADAADLAARAAGSYALDASVTVVRLSVGEGGAVRIGIRPEAGVHVQPQGPLRVTLTASPGVALARHRLGWDDALGPRAEPPRFEVAFKATAPGPQSVKGRLEFFLCSDRWCVKQVREIALDLEVVAAPQSSGDG